MKKKHHRFVNRYENYHVALRTALQTQVTNKRDTPNPNTFFEKNKFIQLQH